MDRQQALHSFWSSFGYSAYEENSVPEDAEFPYITYEKILSSLGSPVSESASIWTRGDWWTIADTICNTIMHRLKNGGVRIRFDGGILWVNLPDMSPFAQSMDDENDKLIKRYVLSPTLHWLSE